MAKGEKPDFVARTTINRENRDPYWVTLGAAWHAKDGAISVRLQTMPVDWDGQFVLVVPRDDT